MTPGIADAIIVGVCGVIGVLLWPTFWAWWTISTTRKGIDLFRVANGLPTKSEEKRIARDEEAKANGTYVYWVHCAGCGEDYFSTAAACPKCKLPRGCV